MPSCAIALGSNLGDSRALLEAALVALDSAVGVSLQRRSRWYRTLAVGPPQPDYLNGCAILQVERSPQELLSLLLATEDRFGRVRQQRWGARTLDLDLLLYDELVLHTPELEIPHPRMHQRAFVLVPLAEISPHRRHPQSGKTIGELLQSVDTSGVNPV